MFVNVILNLDHREVVPVRAVPFFTGGTIGPLGIAQILADPNMHILAYELVASTPVQHKQMLPKNWNQFKAALVATGKQEADVASLRTIGLLPASTIVYCDDLQRIYEDNFLPPQHEITDYTQAERENFQLQPEAFVPDEFVDLVFEGVTTLVLPTEVTAKGDSLAVAESVTVFQGDPPIDFNLLATRAQLLSAFGNRGLKKAWFNELNSHSWLLAARRSKGQGQRGNVVEPLFCPLAVMNGLVTSIRGVSRMSADNGWSVLERHFPHVAHANSFADPRERSG